MSLKKIAYNCRLTVLDMIKQSNSGHIGGSMSCIDILVTLYHQIMRDDDRFILSKGHCAEALYAVLASKGILSQDMLSTFGQFDTALAAHPTKKAPSVAFATGALGHGLSVGVGMAIGNNSKVYVLMGDGELAEGSVWEAAMAAAKYKLNNLIAIVDRNNLQISGNTEDVMPLENLETKFKSFDWEVRKCSGHEPDEIVAVISEYHDKPIVIIANTVKGYGSEIMENKANWHHHIPDDAQYAQIKLDFMKKITELGGEELPITSISKRGESLIPAQPNKVSVRKAFTSTIENIAAANESIYMVCTDSRGSVTSTGFAEKFPDRFIEVGIAEQNALSIAAGLATTDKRVFACGPACFLTARGYEQIKVDVAYNQTNVKIIGVSAGVSYGPLGGTHTTLQDFASIRTLPNIEIFAPCDKVQAEFVTTYLATTNRPAYMRIGRGDVDQVYSTGEKFDIYKAKTLLDGTDITIIACGEMVYPALLAGHKLQSQGIYARVIDMFCLKPADTEAIINAAKETNAIVTVEEHSIFGGLGELVCGVVTGNHPVPVKVMGFPDEECKVGSSQELFEYYGLTPDGIVSECRKLVQS